MDFGGLSRAVRPSNHERGAGGLPAGSARFPARAPPPPPSAAVPLPVPGRNYPLYHPSALASSPLNLGQPSGAPWGPPGN